MEEKAYFFGLVHSQLTPRRLNELISRFGSPKALWEAQQTDFGAKDIEKGLAFRKTFPLPERWEKFQRSKIHFVSITEESYPKALKEIFDPPLGLFFQGDLCVGGAPGLAIVGSRNASAYGKSQARRWGESLAASGFCIVSGLARGIDMAAHQGALDGGGKTVAVLGSGLDHIYPPENKNLAKRIGREGGLISEFPPGTLPHAWNFPRRNRIISGLSLGVLVIEAGEKSGALITAKFALEQGREVFALPGLAGSEYSKGSNGLIQSGAKLVQEIGDVLEEFPYLSFKTMASKPVGRDAPETKILNSLEGRKEGKVVEILMQETGLPMDVLTGTLLLLETRGLVLRLPGNIYTKA